MIEFVGILIVGRETKLVEQPVIGEGVAVADAHMQRKRTVGGIVVVPQCAVGKTHCVIARPRGKPVVQDQTLFPVGKIAVVLDAV